MAKKSDLRVRADQQQPDEPQPEETENSLEIRFRWTGRLTKRNVAAALAMLGLIAAAIVSAIRLIQEIWK